MSTQTQPAAQAQAAAPAERTFVQKCTSIAALIGIAAISSPISQATLAPVFGAITSAVNHKEAVVATSILAFLLRFLYKGFPKGSVAQCTAVIAFWVPVVQMYLFRYSGSLGPVGGPALIGFLSCHVILIPTVYAAAEALEGLAFRRRFGPYAGSILPAAFCMYQLASLEREATLWLPKLCVKSEAFNPVNLQLILASAYMYLAPSKYVLVALPAFAHTFFLNPHFPSSITNKALNSSLETHNWTLLDRTWSNTGYISVLENKHENYRVMRCDHSLLGGEWLLTDERREKEGWTTNEPIYAVFEMLEAVRVLELDTQIQDDQAKALVVGLGIGTAPKALLAHGIDTTVVELDPAVHEYATKYFDLPSNHTAVIDSAIYFVKDAAAKKTTYDYILHDVFTGGVEPLPLFTIQFLRDLRTLLKPTGAIALNYAGDVNAPLTSKILNTIHKAFDGRCKIYRDTPSPEHAENSEANAKEKAALHQNFSNIVTFCRNSPGSISFRKPTAADFLGSKSREHYLLPDPKAEIPFPLPHMSAAAQAQVLRIGEEQAWFRQQAESASEHWRIMRKVVPDAVWELW